MMATFKITQPTSAFKSVLILREQTDASSASEQMLSNIEVNFLFTTAVQIIISVCDMACGWQPSYLFFNPHVQFVGPDKRIRDFSFRFKYVSYLH